MILLDWTRMGRQCCLAGVVMEDGRLRVVRPFPARHREAPVRNIGWSPFLLDGHSRWDIFELIDPQAAEPQPPHVEDLWIRCLRPCGRSAPCEQRRAILQATMASPSEPVFGAPLTLTWGSAQLAPGMGRRSLATKLVPSAGIRFTASMREGAIEPDVRVALHIAPLGNRFLPMKDHHLLLRAERAAADLKGQEEAMNQAVRAMGAEVAVRLGLSRGFVTEPDKGSGMCWLMVDGFFSPTDPQP
jgi:hypothetical protein